MDSSFVSYLNISVRDGYLKNQDIPECIVDELVQASLRVNYGQNTNVHEFVGKNLIAYTLNNQSFTFHLVQFYISNFISGVPMNFYLYCSIVFFKTHILMNGFYYLFTYKYFRSTKYL